MKIAIKVFWWELFSLMLMRRQAWLLIGVQLLATISYAQIQKGEISSAMVPVPGPHYQAEYTLDVPTHPELWNTGQNGLHVSFASTNDLYFRTEVPETQKESKAWTAAGWRGERLNTQILVWSADTIEQVRFKVSDLVNTAGGIIRKENITLNMVRYVLSNFPYGAKDVDCGGTPYKNVYLLPDRFEKFDRFDLPGRTLRPVWLSLDIPRGINPGTYKGHIEVITKGHTESLLLDIKVQSPILPAPHEWKYRLDLWQNPWVLAAQYHIEPWSNEFNALLKKHMKLYADAGGKYITTYAVHSPWADNSYTNEGAMIDCIKKADGSWKFSYKIFDEYVNLAMSVGIDKAITIYTPVPDGNRFRYKDEKTGDYVYVAWVPGSAPYKAFWNIFLTDIKAHLEKKGWFGRTYIGINESALDQTLAAIKTVKSNSKQWKITYAGDWHPELDTLLDDYSYLYGKESDMDKVRARTGRGSTTTYYVCCNPPKPNTFVFSPPVEGRWISWYSAAYGYNGFLRWAYDAWPADPLRDARHGSWAAGDCYLIYPGGNSCIRFEKLREGIVDYEKIRLLRESILRSGNKKSRALLTQLNEHLKTIAAEKGLDEQTLKAQIATGQKLIEELSVHLNK